MDILHTALLGTTILFGGLWVACLYLYREQRSEFRKEQIARYIQADEQRTELYAERDKTSSEKARYDEFHNQVFELSVKLDELLMKDEP